MQNWEESRMADDVVMRPDEVEDGDIVIPIMGQTASGKSTLINNLLGRWDARVSDGITSCTQRVQHYIVEIPEESPYKQAFLGRRLVLVDSPGFDDTDVSDSEILRRISVWLAASYQADMKVGGVIYTYRIYPGRISRGERANLKVFQAICGQTNLTKIALATTHWNICPPGTGEPREEQLRTKFWQDMLGDPEGDGSNMALMTRLENSPDSAWELINKILGRLLHADVDGAILKLQTQLVDKHKAIRETDAAQELSRKLKELLEESGTTDVESRREVAAGLARQVKSLKLPLRKRILRFFKRLTHPMAFGFRK